MLGYLFQFFLAVCCFLMFVVKREYKIAILLFAFSVLSEVSLPKPLGNCSFIVPICYIVSELPYTLRYIEGVKTKLIWWVLGIVLVSTLFYLSISPNYRSTMKGIISIMIIEFFGKYFILLLSFIAAANEKSLAPLTKAAYYSLIILTVFGIINFITGNAAFLDNITFGKLHGGVSAGEYYAEMKRFRVQSLYVNAFSYGYTCIMLMLLIIYGYQKKIVSKNRLAVGVSMAVFGILTCACRTVLVSSIAAVVVFYMFRYSWKKSLLFLGFVSIFVFIAYYKIGIVRYIIDFILSIFDDNSEVGGSSMELRITQLMRVIYYIKDDWFLGRGLGFLWYDLGLKDGAVNMIDQDIKGLESVFYVYMLERGILGYILYLIPYIMITRYLLLRKKYCTMEVAWAIMVLAAYLIFAHMTGELRSAPETMILLGVALRRVQDLTFGMEIERERQRLNRYRYRQLSVR